MHYTVVLVELFFFFFFNNALMSKQLSRNNVSLLVLFPVGKVGHGSYDLGVLHCPKFSGGMVYC